jgi:molecular chaperone DnaK
VRDGQTQVRILVQQRIQGSPENEMLGEFVLDGLRPAPRGAVRVEVMFRMGADGIVSVAARDCETQRAQAINISATSRLTPDEIKRMIAENERVHLAATESDVVELNRVDVERRVRDLDKLLQDIGKHKEVPDSEPMVRQAQDAISRVREALNGRDTDAIIAGKLQLEKTTADLRSMLERSK